MGFKVFVPKTLEQKIEYTDHGLVWESRAGETEVELEKDGKLSFQILYHSYGKKNTWKGKNKKHNLKKNKSEAQKDILQRFVPSGFSIEEIIDSITYGKAEEGSGNIHFDKVSFYSIFWPCGPCPFFIIEQGGILSSQ